MTPEAKPLTLILSVLAVWLIVIAAHAVYFSIKDEEKEHKNA